jgi:hypothetical protein
MALVRWIVVYLLSSIAVLQGTPPPATPGTPVATPAATPQATPILTDAVLVGAGDIGDCRHDHDEATAALISGIDGTVFALGDNAYPDGSAENYAQCFDPSWGKFKTRIRPAPGNHDYVTEGAKAYFDYFGAAAGDPALGYYSYDAGAWHVIVLNSNCGKIKGGCGAGSAQATWLKADLAAHPTACALAYWHHPRYTSGLHGDAENMRDLWQILDEAGVDVALSGHDHDYERFAPQDADGKANADGVRQFVVGTGGKTLYPFEHGPEANSEIRTDSVYGVLKLTLHPTSYDWQFIPAEGNQFTDSGSAACK